MISPGKEIFTNRQKTGVPSKRLRGAAVNTGAKQSILKPKEKLWNKVSEPVKKHGVNKQDLRNYLKHFQGGNISSQFPIWKNIIQDQVILDIIQQD